MIIIIVGAGRVGQNLAKFLAEENNEVYLIENDEGRAGKIADKLDVKTIIGNGADPDILRRAQVDRADLVLAVTTTDETNLVVCLLAASFGAKRRIARVRNASLSLMLSEFGYQNFHLSDIFNPELVAAQSIVKTIETPGASEVADFADGKMLLRAFDVPENSPLRQQKLETLRDEDFPWPFLIVSITRREEVIYPKGDTTIESGDRIYVLLPAPSLGEFLTFIDPRIKMPKKIVIHGASITGKEVALELKDKIKDITIVEEDKDLAENIAGEVGSARIINGSACETDILSECGIEAADVFIAASLNDHSNLVSAVLAKQLGAKSTIIINQQPDYLSVANSLDIDAMVNPQHLAVEQVLKVIRGGNISAITKILSSDAEAVEFIAETGSPITKDVIRNVKLPNKAIVGAVYSGEDVSLVNGDTQIKAGQKVIVFCQTKIEQKLQEFFVQK